MSLQLPAAEIITVPGARTSPSLYFCFIDKESFPVGILIPSLIAKSETACTASYSLASSPSLLEGHIQFAESETDFKPSSKDAQMIFVKASAMEFRDPAIGSTKAEIGECPIEVATPSFPL